VDLLAVKGALLDALASASGRRGDLALEVAAGAAPGCAAGAGEVRLDGRRIGWFGRIHPDLLAPLEIRQPLFAAEADLSEVLPQEPVHPRFRPLSRYPRVTRDACVLVDRNRPYGDIIAAIRKRLGASAEAFESVELIDRYEGRGVPEDRVSLTFSVAYRRHDRTLRQEEVDELHGALVGLLVDELGAELRA
jgi:phenylalanyl-tRNA synthetase beta chain